MQDRRQLCFGLGLAGGLFASGSGLMMAFMSLFMINMFSMPGMSDAPVDLILAMIAWTSGMSIIGGIVMCIGAFRLRVAVGPELRRAAVWALVGGGIAILGGNFLAAGLGIAAGVVAMAETPTAPA